MVNADPFLSGAIDVAAELATAAHWGHQGPTWRGRDVSHEPSGNWQIIDVTIGSDLYAGTAGLARLFAGVSAVVAADGYRDLATRTARQAVGTELEQGDTTGWFSGGLGVAATGADRKSTRLNSSHVVTSRMPSSA